MKGFRLAFLTLLLMMQFPAHPFPQIAPQFALANNQGLMVYKSSLKGNLIISFFASYCLPCKKELPLLLELEKKYGKPKNLSLVLISADVNDGEGEANEKAGAFLKKIGIKHDYLLDIYHVVIAKYNPNKTLPATFLVNRNGYIVFKEIGAKEDSLDRLEKSIKWLH